MKKILFSFCLLHSFNAVASQPTEVYIGGQFNFNSAMVGQNSEYTQTTLPHGSSNKNSLDKDNYLAQEAYIDIVAIGKTDNATLYGGRAVMQLDSQRQHTAAYDSSRNLTYTDSSKSVYTRRAYMFLEKKSTGRLEFGDVEGASKKLKFDASYRFGGTGGIAGNWWKYVNIPDFGLMYDSSVADGDDNCSTAYSANDIRYCGVGGKGNMSFIIRPDLPMSHGYSITNGADKFDDTRTIGRVSYFSPRVSGVQFGVSYASDSGDRGASYYGEGLTAAVSNDVRDVIDWGINYVEQFNDFGIGVSLTGERGFSENTDQVNETEFLQTDLSAYAAGIYLFLGNLSISGSYGTWNDSLMMVRADLDSTSDDYREDEANYFTAGIAYQFGPYKFGVSHMTSSYREQDFILTSAAFDYYVGKNMSLYAEVNNYEFDARDHADTVTAGTTANNSGEVILLGARLRFGEFDSVSQIVLDTSQDSY